MAWAQINLTSQVNQTNTAKAQLETRMFKAGIWIVYRIIRNWQLREGACNKMVDTSETMVKTATWTFSKSLGTTSIIGCVTAIKLTRWTIQLRMAKLVNHSTRKDKWHRIQWVRHSSKKVAKIKNSIINSIIKMQHKISKAILLESLTDKSSRKWIRKQKKIFAKKASNQWFQAIQMTQRANLIVKNIRKKVINIWFYKWDKAMTRCKTNCLYSIWVKMHLLYSIILVPFNFKFRNKCCTLWKRSSAIWKLFCHKRKTRWPRWTFKMVKTVIQQIQRENLRV